MPEAALQAEVKQVVARQVGYFARETRLGHLRVPFNQRHQVRLEGELEDEGRQPPETPARGEGGALDQRRRQPLEVGARLLAFSQRRLVVIQPGLHQLHRCLPRPGRQRLDTLLLDHERLRGAGRVLFVERLLVQPHQPCQQSVDAARHRLHVLAFLMLWQIKG